MHDTFPSRSALPRRGPMMPRRLARSGLMSGLLLAAASAAGCVGEVGDTGAAGNSGGQGSGSGGSGGSGANGTGTGGRGTTTASGGKTGTSSGGTTGSGGVTGSGATQGSGSGGKSSSGSGGASSSGSGGASSSALPVPPSALPKESACGGGSPGPRMLRRLSAAEMAATIPTLFGDTTVPMTGVFQDPSVLGFHIDANSLLVQDLNADQLMSNAEGIAHWAVTTPAVLSRIAPCQTTDDSCQTRFITTFGKRVFRAPPSSDRVTAYKKIFAAETSFSDGAEAVISAMLQSPYFLYKTELGTSKSGMFPLTPYEVATSLSYLLTGNTPDDNLLSAADSWSTPPTQAQVDAQVDRLLSPGPALQTALMGFFTGWLGLDRLATTAKDNNIFMLTDALRADMMSETTNLVVDTFTSGGSVGDLFSADHSFLNKNLATFYGISTNNLGTSFSRVSYPFPGPRDRGILAHASILNGYARPDISSPTQRGHLVRSRILCQDVPPPPANLDTKLHDPTSATPTTRAQYEQHMSQSPCNTCHTLMDPIGFGFENYDAFGRYRTTQNGAQIDPSNVIYQAGSTGQDLKGANLTELGMTLASSNDVKTCSARYWAYYAYGSVSWEQDGCTYDAIRTAAASGNYSLKSVLKAIIHASHFTTRVQDK